MSLIDEAAANKLEKVDHVKINSGGSAGNTIATISQLGSPSSFIGKVALDEFGKKFIHEIEKSGTHYASKNYANSSSAKSFILVSPDAQRTMCTFLGCASEFIEEDISEREIKNHDILYLEGYLWDQETTIKALKRAISLAKANEVKIAFTRGKDGFVTFQGQEISTGEAEKIDKLVDTTGAGDAFAAGFLHLYCQGVNPAKSAAAGNICAAKIIQKFGARFDNDEIEELKNAI